MSFLTDFNGTIFPLMSGESWAIFEISCGLLIFFIGLWQRVTLVHMQTTYRTVNFWGVIVSQIAIYTQMCMAMFVAVDGYYMFYDSTRVSHIVLIFLAASMALGKVGTYMTQNKKFLNNDNFS